MTRSPRPIVITIDGPAGTGKSSVARALARRLGLDFLDTGAMYRAAAAIVLDQDLPRSDAHAIASAVAAGDIRFDWTADPPRILAFDHPVDQRIRDADVTSIVSEIAGIAEVRREMVERQRQIALEHRRLVTEGRDQGSVVFPDAPVKFYLDADAAVRARRRAEQLRAAGQHVDEPALQREIEDRDASDSRRPVGPLTCPADAIRVNTSHLTFEQVVTTLEDLVRERVQTL